VSQRKAGLITVGSFLIDKIKHVSESIFRSNCWSKMIGLRVRQPGSVRSANVLATMHRLAKRSVWLARAKVTTAGHVLCVCPALNEHKRE
jgi:hypothetical protein